jgi:hypothetical protein
MDTLYTRGKVDSMWNAETGWQNSTHEKGFPIYKNFTQNSTTGELTITNYYPGPMQGSSASMYVSISFFLQNDMRAAAQAHNHTDSGVAAPSTGDIFELVKSTHFSFPHFSSKMRYEGSFIQAANGSKYAIAIANDGRALNFYSYKEFFYDSLSHDWNQNSTAGFAYQRAFSYFYNLDSTTSNPARALAANELAQAAVLTSYDTGIILMKQDGSGKFKPIVIDIKPDPAVLGRKIYVRKCL